MYNIHIGRTDEDKKKFGDKGLVYIGKSYVKMGQTSSLSNNIFLDVARPHVLLISGKRGSGKCVDGDTLITLEDGSILPIKDLENVNKKVFGLNEKLKVAPMQKEGFYKRTVNNIIKLKLRSGKEIKLTPEHPLLTVKGWKPVEELSIGGRIATPRKQEAFGNDIMENYKIKLLAYLIAEGHTRKSWVLFSNADETILEDFKQSVKEFDGTLNIELHSNPGCYRVANKNNRYGFRKNPVKEWLKSLDCHGYYAKEKFIPKEIFRLNKENIRLFLNRLFSCDGSIYKNRKGNSYGWEIDYSSSSKQLIHQVYHLLLRFGILSRVRDKKVKFKGKLFDSYELVINPENCIKYIEEIGFYHPKKIEKSIQCLEEVKEILRNPNVDTIPKEIWDLYRPENWAKIGRAMGYKHPKAMRERIKYACSRNTLLQISEIEQHEGFMALATSDIFWDEIVSMEKLEGGFEVYDISVPGHHNFVANDIIIHNSYSASVIAEEVTKLPSEVKKNISVLFFDTLGVFWTMKYPNQRQSDLLYEWGLEPEGLDIDIYTPEGHFEFYKEKGIPTDYSFAIKVSELTGDDWCSVFDIEPTSSIGILIDRMVADLKETGDYDIPDIISKIEADLKSSNEVRGAAENLFLAASKWGLFSKQGTLIEDLLKPGKVSVLDISVYTAISGNVRIKSLVIGLVSKKLLAQRIAARKAEEIEEITKGESYFQERGIREKPMVWIMIDECLTGDSEIITDKAHTPIKDIVQRFENGEKFKVLGYDLNGNRYGYYDVTKVYKKGKRKVLEILTKSGRKLVCTENHRILTRKGFDYSLLAKEVGVPLSQHYDQNKDAITARLIGYLLGDGWLSKSKIVGFSGKNNKEDLIKIKNDLKAIGLSSGSIYTRKTTSKIRSSLGKEAIVKGISTSIQASRKAYYFFKDYGLPEGQRVLQTYNVPKYLLKASQKEKCEFLAGLMGADGYRLSINKNCRVDPNPIRISFNKDKALEKNAFKFASDLKKLFESVGVKISKISKFKGNIRKDGVETIKITITISKALENTIRFLEKVGYRYCEDKELRANKWLNYLKIKLNFKNQKRKIKEAVLREYKKGSSGYSLSKKYSIPYYQVKWWLKVKGKSSVNHDFIKFDDWEDKFCSDKVCYETIVDKKIVGEKEVYDISVDKVRNFVANGCIVHNCHEFLPRVGKTAASDALISLLREGRQPGISLVMVTQQPGEIHKDVLTQSDIVLSHRLTAKADIEALNAMMQSYLTKDLRTHLNDLPRLKGAGIILDDNSERIYPLRVHPKRSWHGGEAPSAIKMDKKEELEELL